MTTGKTITLTRQTFVGKVMSLLFNMLSRLVITFLPRIKHLLFYFIFFNDVSHTKCDNLCIYVIQLYINDFVSPLYIKDNF